MSTAVATAPAPPDTLKLAADLRIITQELANIYVERREPLEVIMIGVLAKVHTFLLGPPGTAKSSLISALCQRIDGSEFFRVLLNKQLSEDALFGAIDIAAYERGEGWVRDFQDTAATAHLAFLDEVGKAGSGSLNPLLTLLEERMHKPGKTWLPAPLLSAIGASNELIETEEDLGAIWDRFMLRLEIDYIQEPGNFAKLLRSKIRVHGGSTATVTSGTTTTVDLGDVMYAVNEVIPFIDVPQGIIDSITKLRADLRSEEIRPSDRRWATSVSILQASAFFNGRSTVDDDDLLILRHVLWNIDTEKSTVRSKVMALGSPVTRAAIELSDALDDLEREIASRKGESKQVKSQYGGTATYTANQVEERLNKATADAEKLGRSVAPLEQVKAQLLNVRYEIMIEYLRMTPERARAALGISA